MNSLSSVLLSPLRPPSGARTKAPVSWSMRGTAPLQCWMSSSARFATLADTPSERVTTSAASRAITSDRVPSVLAASGRRLQPSFMTS